MELQSQILLVLAIMVSLPLEKGWWCHGCLDQERDALLQIKASFNNHINTTWPPQQLLWRYSVYPHKTPWEIDSNCCNWQMVECNNITGRVTGLYLGYVRTYLNQGEMYLNASLFLPFEELKELSLAKNQISGCIENKGFERLSKLSKLEFLDLSGNNFNNTILSSLNGITSLKYLVMRYNRLKGTFDFKELDGLSNLELLDLGFNEINRVIASTDDHNLRSLSTFFLDKVATNGRKLQLPSFQAFPNLKTVSLTSNNFEGAIFGREFQNSTNVEELFLDGSSLDERSFQSLEALTSLKRLTMSWLNGTLPSQGIPNLKNLEHFVLSSSTVKNSFMEMVGMLTSLKTLSLDYCSLNGTLPRVQGLCQLKHLRELRMNNNDITGSLPGCFANLTSLEVLDLSSNHFSGKISPIARLTSIQLLLLSENNFQVSFSLGSFFNHSKLKILNAQNNEIYVESEEMRNLTPKFQLKQLILSTYEVSYAEVFPEFLRHQHDLQFVDLSHISISGSGFPYWLLENNANLEKLLLVDNSLSGPLMLPNLSHKHLSKLDISGNSFYGHIPEEIGTTFQSLSVLNMARNAFSGSIPSSVGKMKWLSSLDLSNNRLSGRIPESLAVGCFSLNSLILSNNNLQGQIFSKGFNLQQLGELLLDDNNFTGGIPDSLFNSSLRELDVRNNSLSGRIPMWMANMSSLQALDLSHNHMSRTLPSNFCPPSLTEVYLSYNQLQGSLADAFVNCSQLVTIHLTHNYFTGRIPEWIEGLSQLNYLLLGFNNLEGEIPIQLCKLKQLRVIDLSNNNLSGHILPCLKTSPYRFGHLEFFFANGSMEQYLEFTTKSISYSYTKSVLLLFFGIDLSSNNFVGEIPPAIGNLSSIQVLNLSHNSLTGPIPSTFSNLRQIESLDLSYNKLDGRIPPQIVGLFSLSYFCVAHNNLSGKTPERVAQFATFDKNSYEGNPSLCGLPLPSCTTAKRNSIDDKRGEDSSFIDMETFYVSFVVSYIIVLMGISVVLFINPYWRRRWLYFIELKINSCYYFIVDNFSMMSKFILP